MGVNLDKFLKQFVLILIVFISLSFISCKNDYLAGRWESSSAVSYEFNKKTYVREVNILFTVAKISGSYRIDGDKIYTTAERISFDDGETWRENNGEIFPVEEQSAPFVKNSNESILISNVGYKKVK